MTLFKQMALAVSLLIVTILASVMYINYQSAKSNMLAALYETTVNNISTLSSKLNVTEDNPALLQSVIDSEFDSGYYELIDFTSNNSNFHYRQVDHSSVEGVPLWFIDLTDIRINPISADVTNGWNIIGEVKVAGDTAIVYESLYKLFTNLLYIFSISVSVALLVLYVLLYFVLKPLKYIRHQAESILHNEFLIQNNIPYTTEFREVVKGMNAMVKKVEQIFNEANAAATRNRELLYNDPITKLFNRRYLMLKLPELIKLECRVDGGSVLLIALSGAEILNTNLGRKRADEFFLSLAMIFKDVAKKYDDSLLSRVNGTEFTLILPNCETQEVEDVVKQINRGLTLLLTKNELNHNEVYINMGIYRYNSSTDVGGLLTRADNALTLAKTKQDENTHIYQEQENKNALGKEQWRSIITESINKKYFSLKFYTAMNIQTKVIEHKLMTFTIDGGKDKCYFYGDFIAPAINLGLVSKIYTVALKELLTSEHTQLDNSVCSVRLSNEFIKDPLALRELASLLSSYAKTLKFKLIFELSDNICMHNTPAVRLFVELFKKHSLDFGINSFTGEASDFNYLKELNPVFIKADTEFLLDQPQEIMSNLQVIMGSLGIDLIATYTRTKEEVQALSAININKVQGPVTDIDTDKIR